MNFGGRVADGRAVNESSEDGPVQLVPEFMLSELLRQYNVKADIEGSEAGILLAKSLSNH